MLRAKVAQYKDVFGDDYYLEIQTTALQKTGLLTSKLLKLRGNGIKFIAT